MPNFLASPSISVAVAEPPSTLALSVRPNVNTLSIVPDVDITLYALPEYKSNGAENTLSPNPLVIELNSFMYGVAFAILAILSVTVYSTLCIACISSVESFMTFSVGAPVSPFTLSVISSGAPLLDAIGLPPNVASLPLANMLAPAVNIIDVSVPVAIVYPGIITSRLPVARACPQVSVLPI